MDALSGGFLFGRVRFRRIRAAFLGLMLVVSILPLAPVPALAAPNEISVENALVGNPSSEWDVSGSGDPSIQGFATDISVDQGGTVFFKVDTVSTDYRFDVYRLGYYAGLGARKVATVEPSAVLPQVQPACLEIDGTTNDNLIDCGNWVVSGSWVVPTDAVSGIYIARAVREDVGGDLASHIVFVVRDDDGGSDLLFQTSDTTWQAYNRYGGYSLYDGPGHAHKVSYNRPFTTRAAPTEDWLFNAEYPMVRWLERNGYDVSYFTGVDSNRYGAEILEHEVFLSVGHDEYWSAGQRANVEAARDAGVDLAFFSGNEIYWKTRWEASTADGGSTAFRTLVSFKEGDAQPGEHYDCEGNFACDPDPAVWTGLWRQNQTGHDGGRPENALSGQISWGEATTAIQVPASATGLRFWRDTFMTGDTALAANTLGYEFDWEQTAYAASYPPGRITVSDTTAVGKNHKMSLYRASSGALVFGAGTVQWSWGLDGTHDRGASTEDLAMQQATVNILADMGAQPATLQSGLVVASVATDVTAPVSVITSPTDASTVPVATNVAVAGTATDTDGVVGGVEVSVDGGVTWHPAQGSTSWTYTFNAPPTPGTAVQILSRATDDSLNTETPGPGVTVTTETRIPFPDEGPGGPILVVVDAGAANPFGRYLGDILLAEGLNEYALADISTVDATLLSAYDVVVLGEMALTGPQVTTFTDWVTGGGNLIAMRPDPDLASLFGLAPAAGSLAEGYLLVDTATSPGAGIVAETIQYHGNADLYTLDGATVVATLYSNATTATPNPAVTLRSVGGAGGQAAAFTYDLARSVVYTRQGNPAWAGVNGDGSSGPVRADDMFHNGTNPDWVNLAKVTIPQADEQQRLLANLITDMNLDRMPLPRLWYFPRGEKAAVVMTMDEHGGGDVTGRLNSYLAADPPGCSVTDWECVRATTYLYTNAPITNSQIAAYMAQGFEFAVHVNTNCNNFTPASLADDYTTQIGGLEAQFPSLDPPRTQRTHCITWTDWASQPKTQAVNGIGLDTNYYYWPSAWIQNRPGMFTGSGIPMRFADIDGTLINVYQATTQMTDESAQTYPATINALLDNAVGLNGYYGAFVANAHTDGGTNATTMAAAIVSSAQTRSVPVISAQQLLNWIDGRNTSSFENLTWNGTTLGFSVTVGTGANGLQAMVPTRSTTGDLTGITLNGTPATFTPSIIKGVEYALLAAAPGTYAVTYGTDTTPPTVTATSPADTAIDVPTATAVTATFSESVNPATVNGTNFTLTSPAGPIAATVTYSAPTSTATLTPNVALAESTTYTATVSGVTDLAANPMTTPKTWTFTTGTCCTIFGNTPGGNPFNDSQPIETGVRFQSSIDGLITAIRFYKSVPTGTQFTATLWTNTGTPLGTGAVTLAAGLTGWQEIPLTTPVPITANTTYVASHYSALGDYTATTSGLLAGIDNPPLRALADSEDGANGIYLYGEGGGFPTATSNSANYWVDVVFSVPDTTPPTVTVVAPVNGSVGVSTGVNVTAVFSEAMDAATINTATYELRDPSNTLVVGVVSYDPGSRTGTFDPTGTFTPSTTYTVTVRGGTTDPRVKDIAGNALTANSTWTFTTAATPPGGGGGGGVPPVVVSCPNTIPNSGFLDLTDMSDETRQAINCLVSYEISQGTSAETFSPLTPVTRWQMALFLTRQLTVHGTSLPAATDQGFLDIGELPTATRNAINQLAALGIAKGTSGTTYDPAAPVTRWQMALFLVRLAETVGIPLETAPPYQFPDVSQLDAVTRQAIHQLAAANIAKGTSATTFDPYSSVLRWQMALFLTRMLQAGGVVPQ